MTNTPFIAVTMGDGAGVGPEVVVRALLDPQISAIAPTRRRRRHRAGLQMAADLLSLPVDLVAVEAIWTPSSLPGGST